MLLNSKYYLLGGPQVTFAPGPPSISSPVSTDLLQQVDGIPAADHLGGEGGGGGGAPVLLDLLHEV